MFTLPDYKDFDNNELFATFPVDEGHTPVTSIELEVSIEDDNIDEADEQVFIIFLEIINATNLDVVKINRTTSIGRIKDDESKYRCIIPVNDIDQYFEICLKLQC